MSLKKEVKDNIIKTFASSPNDTGSCEVQIALLSERIKQVSQHLKTYPKDEHSRIGLLKMVGRRKSLLKYLKNKNHVSYNKLVSNLKDNAQL